MSEIEDKNLEQPVIRLGVSTCLLGERVRFDGGHKLDRYLTGTLGCFVEWISVCPEVETGLPTPRESMRLVGDKENPRLIAPKSGTDHTEAMKAWARTRVEELAAVGLHGFALKKESPQPLSCPKCVAQQVHLNPCSKGLMMQGRVHSRWRSPLSSNSLSNSDQNVGACCLSRITALAG